MNPLRYAHDFVNMSKIEQRSLIKLMLSEYYEAKKKIDNKTNGTATANPSEQSFEESQNDIQEG